MRGTAPSGQLVPVLNVPLGLLLLLVTSVPVAAPSGGPTIELNPGSAAPGQRVTIQGSGYGACSARSRITVYWVNDDLSLGGKITDTQLRSDASFTATFAVPSKLRPGSYDIAAVCGYSGSLLDMEEAGQAEDAPFEVTAAPSPSSEPPSPSRGSPAGPGAVTTPVTTPFATRVPPTTVTERPGGLPPEQGSPGWVVLLGVVAALVALSVLGRRVARARRQPAHSARLPVVRAVARPGSGGRVEPRCDWHGRTVAVRVVARADPGRVRVGARRAGHGR